MSDGIYTLYDKITLTAPCIACKTPATGILGVRATVFERRPCFELAVIETIDGAPEAHVFAKISLESLAGVKAIDLGLHSPPNPENN